MDELIAWMKGSALIVIIFYSVKGILVLLVGGWIAQKARRRKTSQDSDTS